MVRVRVSVSFVNIWQKMFPAYGYVTKQLTNFFSLLTMPPQGQTQGLSYKDQDQDQDLGGKDQDKDKD